MALFTDTMTVYNYRYDEEKELDCWQRTVVKGVQWSHNRNEVNVSGNVQTANKVESITIDFKKDYGNKPYLPPHEYRKLSSEEVEKHWTLETGKDILVLGISEKEVTCSADIEELKQDFQYVATVTAVSDNRSRPRLKHIKVVAK